MNFIQDLSSATLGYISGNIKGATAAYKLSQKYRKNMAPITIFKKRKAGNGDIRSNFKSTKYLKGMSHRNGQLVGRAKYLGRVKRASRRPSFKGASDNYVARSSKKPKGLKKGGRKNVKVTAGFRKKVTKALEGKKCVGRMREVKSFKFGFAIGQNVQAYGYLDSELAGQHGFFSPNRILDAASCLFNQKTAATNKTVFTNNFSATVTKINVLRQWVDFELSNQTQRMKTVTIYQAEPKSRHGTDIGPVEQWENSLLQDTQTSPTGDTFGPNLSFISPTFLKTGPKLSKSFREKYNVTSTVVKMQPGQTHAFSISGPSKVYDLAKLHDGINTTLSDYTPESTFVFYTVYNDLVETSLQNTGRFEASIGVQPVSIICEYTMNYHIETPESTGFRAAGSFVANGSIPLNLIKDSYVFKNYNLTGAVGTAFRIDDEAPEVIMSGTI